MKQTEKLSRRNFCHYALATTLITAGMQPVYAQKPALKTLWQPAKPTHHAFMTRAIALANRASKTGDGSAYGCVIVHNDLIIGEGWNRSNIKHDATAHAEIEAIQNATQRRAKRSLSGCILYTNGGRPCPMCETASYWADIERIFYAIRADDITNHGAPKYGGC